MHEAGNSINEISEAVGVHPKTVRRWINRHAETGRVVDLPRSGAPKKLNEEQRAEVANYARNTPFTTASEIREDLNIINVTNQTIRNVLHENGLRGRVPAEKDFLSEDHRRARLAFAEEHVNKDLNFWSKVIFTDEKNFVSSDHGRSVVYREVGKRFDDQNILQVKRSGRVTANIWGWHSLNCHGEMAEIYGRFNSEQYIEILDEVMLPTVRAMNFPWPERFYFQHDRSPVHTSRIVRTWFEEHPDFDLLYWPPKGCDFNPIENLWGIMVSEWELRGERNTNELMGHIREVWEGIRNRPNLTHNLIANMHRRLQYVIDANGG